MKNITKESYLRNNLPFFKDLSEKEVEGLFSSSRMESYGKGEFIHSKNKACTGVVLVVNGQLRSFMSAFSGKEITLFRLFELDICMLSASCVFQNLTYDINLEAEKDSSVIIIDSSFFKKLSDNNTSVQSFFLNLTQNSLSEIMWVLEQVVFFSLDNRLSSYLINQYYLNDSNDIYITHDGIANDLGSAREVISRMLKKFEKDGLVKISRGIIKIVDIEGLKSLCE
jgi:CRP/FNR family transcriptional regulator, anaerobic regulatory protein